MKQELPFPQVFSILPPPKRAKLAAFASQAPGFTFMFAVMIAYGGWHASRGFHDEVHMQTIEGNPNALLPCLVIAGLLGASGIGIFIYRKLKPVASRKEPIGQIQLSREGIDVTTDAAQHSWRWHQVQRLDIYLSYGAFMGNSDNFHAVFKGTEALHLRFKTAQGLHHIHVLNSNNELGRFGDLYEVLQQFRKLSPTMHRRIQFWNKQRTG